MAELASSSATLSPVELDLKSSLLECIGHLRAHETAPGSVEPTKLRHSSLFIHLVASNSTRNVEEVFSTHATETAFNLERGHWLTR
jgi:hypothetical protein